MRTQPGSPVRQSGEHVTASTTDSATVLRVALAAVRAGVPVVFRGKSGVGKTAKTTTYFKEHGYHIEVVAGGAREASDFTGLPIERDSMVEYAPLGWAVRCNRAQKALAFLDELGENEASFSGMLRVLQDRVVGDLPLGDHVALIAAMNPADISVSGLHLPGPIANRMLHLEWVFAPDEWSAGLRRGFVSTGLAAPEQFLPVQGSGTYATVAGRVLGYLRTQVGDLEPAMPVSKKEQGQAWASPRSWHNATRVLAQLPADDEAATHLVLCGTVGEAIAIKYLKWVRDNDLYDVPDVLDGTVTVDWTGRIDRLWSLADSLASYGLHDPKRWRRALDVLADGARTRPDVVYPAAHELLRSVPPGQTLSRAAQQAFASILAQIGVVSLAG